MNNIRIEIHRNVYRGAMFYGIYFLIHTHTHIHSYNSGKLLSVGRSLLRFYSSE